jgi:GntR family transcriptional regulator
VKNHLLAEIQAGKWKEDELVPTDDELCQRYQVSKITVREAMRILANEGILERVQGKGTFIRRTKYESRLSRLFSFTKWARQNGLEPSTRVIKIETLLAQGDSVHELGVPKGTELTRIERLRLGDKEPLCFEEINIASSICPDIHLKDLAARPFNDIIWEDYGIALGGSAVSIEPGKAGPYEGRLLRMKKADLALIVRTKVFALDSRVAYAVRGVYRGDKVKFVIEL